MSQLLERLLAEGVIRPRGVLHLGAEHCQEAPLYDQAGVGYVLWAEASPENWEHEETLRNLRGRPNQMMARFAIWDEDNLELPFLIYNARSANSLFGPGEGTRTWYPGHHPIAKVDVPTATVDTLLAARWPIDRPYPNTLVMDLQGAELKALKGATDFLANSPLKTIVSEACTTPLYEGGCVLEELDAALASHGFVRREMVRHTVGLWYVDTVGKAIERGELPEVPQFDVLYTR
jgi:FkbM family methyltransferase